MISVKTKQTQEINRLQSLKDSLKNSLRPNSEKHAEISTLAAEMSLEALDGEKKQTEESGSSSDSSSSGSSSSSESGSDDSGSSSSEAEVVGDMTIEEEEERANELLRKENKRMLKKGGSISVEFSESDESDSSDSSSSDSSSSSGSSSDSNGDTSILKDMSDVSEGEADEDGRKKSKKKKKSKKEYESDEEDEDMADFIVDDDEVEVADDYDEDDDETLKGKLHKYKVSKYDERKSKKQQQSDESAVDDPKDTPSGSDNEEAKPKRKKNGKKKGKSNGAEYFLDTMSEKKRKRGEEQEEEEEYENLEENEERFYQQEYPMDRNVEVPYELYSHYKNFFILTVASASKPDWEAKLKEMLMNLRGQLEAHNTKKVVKTKEQLELLQRNIKVISSQRSSNKIIKKHLLKCMFFVMCWIRTGINCGKAAHRKTMAKLDSILLKDESSNIKIARFEKVQNTQGTCHVSGGLIRKGQGWLVTITKTDDTEVTYLMDAKWQQFLSYWININSHIEIIRDCARRKLDTEGSDKRKELEEFQKDENVSKFARTVMASLAFFYKMLRDTQFDIPFRNNFPENWYNVCKLNHDTSSNKRAKK